MTRMLLWFYVLIATLLIVHEMDSVRWREYELFGLPGGVEGFLLIHLPLLSPILYGIAALCDGHSLGLVLSLALGLIGLLAFGLHTYLIKRGSSEFTTPVSQGSMVDPRHVFDPGRIHPPGLAEHVSVEIEEVATLGFRSRGQRRPSPLFVYGSWIREDEY